MDGTTIYSIVTGSIGTALSVFLLIRMIATEYSKLSAYITDWEIVSEADGYIVIKLRAIVQNKSRVANTVERFLLKARGEKNFAFEPGKLRFLNDGKAWLDYFNGHIEQICDADKILPLPTNIDGKRSTDGWLAFSIAPEFAEKARKQKWCLKIFDQSNKSYLSSGDRDQVIQ